MSVTVEQQAVTVVVEQPNAASVLVSAPTPVTITEATSGPQGPTGPQGAAGPQGPAGELPTDYTDPVDSVLLFENALV